MMEETPPPSLQYGRMNPADHFERPRSEEGHKVIQRWLDNDYSYKWERVQVGYRVIAPRLQRAEELEDRTSVSSCYPPWPNFVVLTPLLLCRTKYLGASPLSPALP